MILRIARGRVRTGGLGGLAEAFDATYVPDAQRRPGLAHFHVVVRPDGADHEVLAITLWNSVEAALQAFGDDLSSGRTLGEIGRFAQFSGADHYEVDESQLRQPSGRIATLRLSAGRVGGGGEAAILEELRRRLPELGDEMIDHFVGRRLVGTDVEVAFVSTWSRAPEGRSLDEPMWPDISARFHQFWIRTYTPIST